MVGSSTLNSGFLGCKDGMVTLGDVSSQMCRRKPGSQITSSGFGSFCACSKSCETVKFRMTQRSLPGVCGVQDGESNLLWT